jgi:glycosyltransferase involved in cell wall biosynthesis
VSYSVVIPAYNAAALVARAIDSVRGQEPAPSAIIVVDDGSTDDTATVAAACGPDVYVHVRPNGGPGAARNLGVRHASTPWIAFLDADDRWRPGKLAAQWPHASHPEVDVVYSIAAPRIGRGGADAFDVLWEANDVPMSSVLLRRSAFERVGGFDEDRALIGVEDYNLWLRLAAAGARFVALAGDSFDYLRSAASLSVDEERMAAAEMANLEKLASMLELPRRRVAAKRASVLLAYARNLLAARRCAAARQLAGASLLAAPTPAALGVWCAALLPPRLLDARRALRRGPRD